MSRSIATMIETAVLESDSPVELTTYEEEGKIFFTVDCYPDSFTREKVLDALRDLYDKVTGREY